MRFNSSFYIQIGNQEVIEGLPYEQPRSDIDRMIAALAQRQYGQENSNAENDLSRSESFNIRYVQRTGMRRYVHDVKFPVTVS